MCVKHTTDQKGESTRATSLFLTPLPFKVMQLRFFTTRLLI